MKMFAPIKVFGAMLLAAVAMTASNVSAHTPRSRPVEATVESATDFRVANLARHALEVYEPDWPNGEIYRRYRQD